MTEADLSADLQLLRAIMRARGYTFIDTDTVTLMYRPDGSLAMQATHPRPPAPCQICGRVEIGTIRTMWGDLPCPGHPPKAAEARKAAR